MTMQLKEIEMICNDAFGIQSRLLDHQAVIKSECKFLIREFETKKNNEISKSFFEMKLATEKVKQKIPECVKMLDDKLEKLHQKIVHTAASGIDILNDSHDEIRALKETLKIERERELELNLYEMQNTKDQILRKHEKSMQELEDKK